MVLNACSPKTSFQLLSDKIYLINGGDKDKSTFKISSMQRDARRYAFLADSTGFLRSNISDTLYILEAYHIENGIVHGRIWNHNNAISYSYGKDQKQMTKETVFSNYEVELISRWDTLQIRNEEKKTNEWLDNSLLLNGSRCYKKGDGWMIDMIYFKDFFNVNRNQ